MDFKDMKYIARQDIFYTISAAEVKRRHDAVRALLQAHDVGVALLLCRDGNARNWVCGSRFGGYLSGGDGLLSGADILLAQGDIYHQYSGRLYPVGFRGAGVLYALFEPGCVFPVGL